jgi:hypothetical protein
MSAGAGHTYHAAAVQGASTQRARHTQAVCLLTPMTCLFMEPCSTMCWQVEVLHHSSPGSAWVVGRVSSRNPDLMEGWAAWVSADTEGG